MFLKTFSQHKGGPRGTWVGGTGRVGNGRINTQMEGCLEDDRGVKDGGKKEGIED